MVGLCAYRSPVRRVNLSRRDVIEVVLTVTFVATPSSIRFVLAVILLLAASNWNPLVSGQLLVSKMIQTVVCNLLCIGNSTQVSVSSVPVAQSTSSAFLYTPC